MRLKLTSLLACLCWLASSLSHAADLQLAELMDALAQIKSGRASFVEQKFIALLDAPVTSSGELYFAAPDVLEKRTLKPKPESVSLKGNELLVERGGRSRRLKLSDYPEVAAFVESMRSTLTGDRATLERIYEVALTGSRDKWTLSLKPRQSRMSEIITRIVISGSQAQARLIEFEQADGDRSVMSVTPLPPAAQTPSPQASGS